MDNGSYWLPIGSVVHISGNPGLFFIIGYMLMAKDGRVWDYAARAYPMGFMGAGEDVFFNRSSIDGVYYLGYQNEDWQQFSNELSFKEPIFQKVRASVEKGASVEEALAPFAEQIAFNKIPDPKSGVGAQ